MSSSTLQDATQELERKITQIRGDEKRLILSQCYCISQETCSAWKKRMLYIDNRNSALIRTACLFAAYLTTLPIYQIIFASNDNDDYCIWKYVEGSGGDLIWTN